MICYLQSLITHASKHKVLRRVQIWPSNFNTSAICFTAWALGTRTPSLVVCYPCMGGIFPFSKFGGLIE